MKKIELNAREKEVLFKLNMHFKLNLPPDKLESNLENILDKAWNEYPEKLHDLGIPKFKIAQMYARILGIKEFVSNFLCWRKTELAFDYA